MFLRYQCRALGALGLALLIASCAHFGWANDDAKAPSAAETQFNPALPTVWLVGDSTVKNGRDNGAGGMWGWGALLRYHFNGQKVNVVNKALGGTSSRSFYARGLWKGVAGQFKPGDFVLIQFGHNDGGGKYDDAKARKSVRGMGEETVDVTLPDGHKETVHSYGWYMRLYIAEAKAKGVTPIICSYIPRNDWTNGKLNRETAPSYATWARESAKQGGALFIELNKLISDRYDAMGQAAVKPFFPNEHTHTNWDGAKLNAECVAQGIRALDGCALKDALLKTPRVPAVAPAPPAGRPAAGRLNSAQAHAIADPPAPPAR